MVPVPVTLASIPSPSSGVVDIGPVAIHMYGLMLLLGIAAAITITGLRWRALGGDWDLVVRAAVWGVAWGIVGARLYHVATSWDELPDHWWGPFAVWRGGLGIWGGVVFGVVAGAVVVRRAGESVRLMLDAVAPALLVAQGIGRWGNWFNQELFGKPTSLPWGLEIDLDHRPAAYLGSSTFHPTFLYEFLYDLLAAGLLVLVGRRFRIRPPALFSLYVALYSFARIFEELLRVDPSHHVAGERVNFWVALGCCLAGLAFFVWWQFFRHETVAPRPRRRPEPRGPAMTVPKSRVRRTR